MELQSKFPGISVLRPGDPKGYKKYYKIDGVKMRRVTTILNATIPKPGLVHWAKNVSLDKFEVTLLDELENGEYILTAPSIANLKEAARNRPDEIKDEAANWGTRAHGIIQNYIDLRMEGFVITDVPDDMAPLLKVFMDFEESLNIEWLATEIVVWDKGVAGSVDAVGLSHSKYLMFDWKTSNGFYPEMALQLSAYAAMFENVYGHKIDQGYVVRFPKEQETDGDFHVNKVADLTDGWSRYQSLIRQAGYKPWSD